MKQLIEEQRLEFEKKYNTSVLIAYPEYTESHMILLTDIWNWHKQSLKQFIDELIEVQNEHMQKELSVERFARPDFYKGYEASKNETIAHLKKLKEELN